jgi:hypothetical protein
MYIVIEAPALAKLVCPENLIFRAKQHRAVRAVLQERRIAIQPKIVVLGLRNGFEGQDQNTGFVVDETPDSKTRVCRDGYIWKVVVKDLFDQLGISARIAGYENRVPGRHVEDSEIE